MEELINELRKQSEEIVPECNRGIFEQLLKDQKSLICLPISFTIVSALEKPSMVIYDTPVPYVSMDSIVSIINDLPDHIRGHVIRNASLLSTRGTELLCALNSNYTLESASEAIEKEKAALLSEVPKL